MKGIIVQFLSCMLLTTPAFLTAFAGAWPSYTINILKGPESPVGYSITNREVDLIGSCPLLGSLIGTIFGGFISETLGRKKTEMFCGLLYILSWSIVSTANSVMLLILARIILGIGGGIHLVTVLVYYSEIMQENLRGAAVNLMMFSFSIGSLTSYLAGWFCSYQVICYSSLSHSVVFVILVCFLKDGPGYLLGKGQEEEALEALKFYRGVSSATKEVLDEFVYLKSQIRTSVKKTGGEKCPIAEETEKLKQEKDQENAEETSAWKILRSSKATQRVLITEILMVALTLMMGISAVQAYAGQLFRMAVPSLSADLCSVLLAVVLAVAGALAGVVVDMFGRRTLFLFSTLTCTLALFTLATMLRWQWAPQWTIPLTVLIYCAAFQLGANTIPLVQLGESLTPQVRSLGSSITSCFLFLSCFVTVLLYGPSVEYLGLDGSFFIYSIIGSIATATGYFILKETRGVKLEAVQDMFEQGYLCRYPNKM